MAEREVPFWEAGKLCVKTVHARRTVMNKFTSGLFIGGDFVEDQLRRMLDRPERGGA